MVKKTFSKFIIKFSVRAFTLIELLVAIAIIGLLVSIVLVSLQGAAASARDGKRDAEVGESNSVLRKTLEVYHNTHGNYPWDPATEDEDGCCLEENTDIKNKLDPYLSAPLEDPLYSLAEPDSLDKHCYRYKTVNHGEDYKIRVNYETGGYKETASWGGGGIVYWDCGDTLAYGGQNYATVLIGSRCWFKENLNAGTMTAGGNEQGTDCPSPAEIEKYCYDNNEANCISHGGLYQWNQAMCGSTAEGAQGICPAGWHIPTHDEWTALEREVCDSGTCATDFPYDTITTGWKGTDEGTQLKTGGSSGFDALPAGHLTGSKFFLDFLASAYLWSSLENGSDAWWRRLHISAGSIYRSNAIGKLSGLSVRCIKD